MERTLAEVEELDRRCVAVEADVRSTADMQRLADTAMGEFGRIDFLLANAGILSLSDTTTTTFRSGSRSTRNSATPCAST